MIVGALFLLLLIFQIPAGAVRLLLPAQAGVSGLSGTLWSGQAIRLLVGGQPDKKHHAGPCGVAH